MTTILLVEDSPDDLELMRLAIRSTGLAAEVVCARDGVKALEALQTGELPAVVLLDLRMPRFDGFQVLERMRASDRLRYVPVVVLSSTDEPGDIRRAYEAGANSFVCKPMGFAAAREVIADLGRYWIERNRHA